MRQVFTSITMLLSVPGSFQSPFRRIRNHKVQLAGQDAALQLLPVIHGKQIAVLLAEIIL